MGIESWAVRFARMIKHVLLFFLNSRSILLILHELSINIYYSIFIIVNNSLNYYLIKIKFNIKLPLRLK